MADAGVELGRQLLALVSSPQPPPGVRPRAGSNGPSLDPAQADFIRALMSPKETKRPLTRPPPGLTAPVASETHKPTLPPPPGLPILETVGSLVMPQIKDPPMPQDDASSSIASSPVLEELPLMPVSSTSHEQPPVSYFAGAGMPGVRSDVSDPTPYAVVSSRTQNGQVSYVPLQVLPVPSYVVGAPTDGAQWMSAPVVQQGPSGALYMPQSWVSSQRVSGPTPQQEQQHIALPWGAGQGFAATQQQPQASTQHQHSQPQQREDERQHEVQHQQQYPHAVPSGAYGQHAPVYQAHQQHQYGPHAYYNQMQQQQQPHQFQSAHTFSPQQYYEAVPQSYPPTYYAGPAMSFHSQSHEQTQDLHQPPPPQLASTWPHPAASDGDETIPPGAGAADADASTDERETPTPHEQEHTRPIDRNDVGTPAGQRTFNKDVDTLTRDDPAQLNLEVVSEARLHHAQRRRAGQLARCGQAAVPGEEDLLCVWLSQQRVKPKMPITVTIVGPASGFGPEHVGLFRASVSDCRKCLAMRTSRLLGDLGGARTVTFHAPKGNGLYDVRVFASNDEDCTPIGRSAAFRVEVQGHDLIEAMSYSHSMLLDAMLEMKLIGQYAYDEARGASVKEQMQRREAALRRTTSNVQGTMEEQLTGLMPPSGTVAAWTFFAQRVQSSEEDLALNAMNKVSLDAPRSASDSLANMPAPSMHNMARITSCISSVRALVNQVRHIPLVFPGSAGASSTHGGRLQSSVSAPAPGAYKTAASDASFLSVDPELCDNLWRILRDARFCAMLCAVFVRASALTSFSLTPAFSAAVANNSADISGGHHRDLCVVPPVECEWAADLALLPAGSASSSSDDAAPIDACEENKRFISSKLPLRHVGKGAPIDAALDVAGRMRVLRSLHGEVSALLQDVLVTSGLRCALSRHRIAIITLWRRSFDPLSELIIPLPYELQQAANPMSRPTGSGLRSKAASSDLTHKLGAGSLSSGDSSALVQIVRDAAFEDTASPASRSMAPSAAQQACKTLQAYADHLSVAATHAAMLEFTSSTSPAISAPVPSLPSALSLRGLLPPDQLPPATVRAISEALQARSKALIPPSDFSDRREAIRSRVAAVLAPLQRTSAAGGREFSTSLFGSSANGFGGDASDVDIALIPSDVGTAVDEDEQESQSAAVEVSRPEDLAAPRAIDDMGEATSSTAGKARSEQAPSWDAVALVVEAGELLLKAGMLSVQVRATARIPVVLFVDPESGLQCDLCAGNPLAERNTALLRAYAEVDPRVRELVFLVKHWASLRGLNDPSKHSLSSYAYVQMCLSVLLSRSPHPVVPCLQALPPSWPQASRIEADVCPIELRSSPEGALFDTYFWSPPPETSQHRESASATTIASPLRDFAQRNNESLGLLFLEFLWQFAFELDPRTTVVSVNNFGEAAYGRERTTLSSRSFTKSRALKSMMSHWRMGSVLAIEDPFEHDYDVAHVLRSQEWRTLRLELGLAYATLASATLETLPSAVAAVFSALPAGLSPPASQHRHDAARHRGESVGVDDEDEFDKDEEAPAAVQAARLPAPPHRPTRWQQPVVTAASQASWAGQQTSSRPAGWPAKGSVGGQSAGEHGAAPRHSQATDRRNVLSNFEGMRGRTEEGRFEGSSYKHSESVYYPEAAVPTYGAEYPVPPGGYMMHAPSYASYGHDVNSEAVSRSINGAHSYDDYQPQPSRYPPLQQFADMGGMNSSWHFSPAPGSGVPSGRGLVQQPDTGDHSRNPYASHFNLPPQYPQHQQHQQQYDPASGASHFVGSHAYASGPPAGHLGDYYGAPSHDYGTQQQQQQLLLLPPQVPHGVQLQQQQQQQQHAQVWGGSYESSSGPMYAGYAKTQERGE